MATISLNATASEFRPQQPRASPAAHSEAGDDRRQRAPRSKPKKKSNTNSNAETTPSNGATPFVPASVQRRRAAGNGSTATAAASASSDPDSSSSATEKKPAAAKKPARKPPQRRPSKEQQHHHHADGETTAEDDDRDVCFLCTDPIEFHAVGECNHHGICSKCSLRMRMLMNDRSCPICKQHLERVVVSKDKRDYESFELWGDAAAGGRESAMDEPSEIIFYECRSHYNTLRALRDFACRVKKCRVVCGSLHKLKDHLRIEHGSEFCELCVSHQHFFIQEQQVFTKNGLRAHNVGKNRSVGPKASGKDFHPMCQFCKRRFYGDMQLYEHLERDHFRCHMCKTEHEYFRNYASLEAHFRREHYLCEDPHCLENRFVVFANDIEYHAHMRSIHGVLNRLVLNFQVARAGENPLTAAAVEDVPDSWSYETEAPVATRRQPSASANDTAFPALPTPATPAPPPLSQPAIAPRTTVTRTNSAPSGFNARGLMARSSDGGDSAPRTQYLRNQRLAEALGLARGGQPPAEALDSKVPDYPTHLVDWGRANLSYLQVVERRLERIVEDAACHSVSLRPMPSDERKLMHELAAFYGVPSESFGEDPFRRISFFKRDTARVPEVTLSSVLRGGLRAPRSARLSFLPLGSSPAPVAAAAPRPPVNASRPHGVSRGWEKIAPKPQRPVVADAWSDDEEEAQEEEEEKATA